jgi:hypothetical protein
VEEGKRIAKSFSVYNVMLSGQLEPKLGGSRSVIIIIIMINILCRGSPPTYTRKNHHVVAGCQQLVHDCSEQVAAMLCCTLSINNYWMRLSMISRIIQTEVNLTEV